jgi:hypothetical protein
MPGHQSYKIINGFDEGFNKLNAYPMNDKRKEIFRKIFDSISKKEVIIEKSELLNDIEFIDSRYLINNIELSFKAWNKSPKDKRASFKDFCNYILPYKNSNEPIEENTRQKLAEKYSWVYDSLNKKVSIQAIVDTIAGQFNHASIENMPDYYPIPLSISQVEKSRVGSCDDGVNYLINVFRSLGIVCAKDVISHWGNHHTLGHSWLYVKYGDQEYSTDVRGKVNLKIKFLGESIPKVNRVTFARQEKFVFSPNMVDVTQEYIPTVNITVSNVRAGKKSQPVLCVFDVNKQWQAVSSGTYREKDFKFVNVGINVLYIAGTLDKNKFNAVSYPFFIDATKRIHFFKPNYSNWSSIDLLRKYGLSSPKSTRNIDWIRNLNGTAFQGANNLKFTNAKKLYELTNFNSTQINKVTLQSKSKYKYVRFYSAKNESYLAKLVFYGKDQQRLQGDIFEENNSVTKWVKGAFDDNPLSFSGGKNVSLGFNFNKPEVITAIEFQVRNDGNHINIGDEYELFYWNKTWKSLGFQIAKDTVLHYKSPSNSLLWLKNLSSGSEEHVFYMNNKKQKWPGFDN